MRYATMAALVLLVLTGCSEAVETGAPTTSRKPLPTVSWHPIPPEVSVGPAPTG